MPSIENKYIDSSSFSTATAVYDDIHLTIKASDGVYQYDEQYRTQLNGLLGPLFQCEVCGIPCGGTLNPPATAALIPAALSSTWSNRFISIRHICRKHL